MNPKPFCLQRVFYFPLTPKLRALLRTKKYHDMCQHEFSRPRNRHLLTDVYDGTLWKKMMGPCNYPNERIGLLGCGDGIPAFAAGTHSLKPWMFKNMSLPPGVRSKLRYMLLWMLFDDTIKPQAQRKYFDWATSYELDELHHRGIDGVKVKIFTITMDTKGREEISGMQTCQAYQSCPVCTHAWSPPLSRGVVADGFRAFLAEDDDGRQQKVTYKGLVYEYKDACNLPTPQDRNMELVQSVCAVATEKNPILGHKFPPVICSWPEFDWKRVICTPELMHGNEASRSYFSV